MDATPPEEDRCTVLLVVDFPFVRQAMACAIEARPWLRVCGEAGTAAEAREMAVSHHPRLAVVDMELALGDGPGLVSEIARLSPGTGIVAYGQWARTAWLRRVFAAGATAYLWKRDPGPELHNCLWHAHRGERYTSAGAARAALDELTSTASNGRLEHLSSREMAVLRRLAAGRGPQAIARDLGVAVSTVETHLARIKAKLALRSAAELRRAAVLWAMSLSA